MSTDHVVLVTGGNRGIGRSIAERFVAEGYPVAVTARSGEGPAGTLTVRADVTDAAAVDAAFSEVEEKLGPVTIVVANAGVTKDTLLLRMSEDDFDSVVATNLGGAFRVVKRAAKGMLRAKWGRVILISSVVGLYGSPGQINYASSKSGLSRYHRQRGGPRLHRDRHDRRAPGRDAGAVQSDDPRGPVRDPRRGGRCGHVARLRQRRLHLGSGHPGRWRPGYGALTQFSPPGWRQ